MGIDADIKFYEYINFPLTLGLDYTFQSDKNTNVFFRGAVVANFLKTTDYTVAVGTSKLSIVFDWAKNYGFKVGGGVLINKKTIIALDLYGLGEHSIDATLNQDGEAENLNIKQKINFLTLTIGFRL